MKKIFYVVMGLCMAISGINGQTTFNKLYPAGLTTSVFDLPNDNNYYSLFYIPQNNQPQLAMAISKISANGNQLSVDTLHLRNNSIDEGISTPYSSTKSYDNKVVAVFTIIKNCTDCVEGCIVKFNSSMNDTLWTKTYKFQGLNAQLDEIIEDNTSHNLYIHGLARVNNSSVSFFACFDASGNLLWEKKHDRIANVMEYISDIAVVGNYLVLSGQNAFTNNSGNYISMHDINGNYLYQQTINGPFTETGSYILPLNNQEILTTTVIGTSPYLNTNYDFESKILLQRINITTNSILNSKYIGANGKNVFGQKPVFLDANKIIFAGSRWDVNRNTVASIYAISTNLDSLWHHEYPNEIDSQNYISWTQFAEIYSTFVCNNSIFTAGRFFTNNTPTAFPPGSPNQYAWVMKLDTLGCLTPNCWTSVENGDPNIWIADNPLGLYPNPANTQVTLRLVDAPQPYQIDVFDAHGKLMFNELRMASDATISTIDFPIGTYFCRATYADKRLGMAKFIVQH